MAHNVSQATHPNLKVPCRSPFISLSRQIGQNAFMHRLRSKQAYSLRHSKAGPRVRVKRLVPKRLHNNRINAKPRKAFHRDPTTGQEKTWPTNPIINDYLPVSVVHDGVPRFKHLRQRVFLAV